MKKIFNKEFKEKYMPDLSKVHEILHKDCQEVLKNRLITIIVVALMIFPSLYAWFNIEAFWDPYGNTKNLSVAIVNQDKDYEFKNQKLNFGNDIVKNLKENRSLDWNFVNSKTAMEGLNTGRYYAILTIPKDFTKSLMSVTQVDVRKARIVYTTNEKTNAIAEKITDQGANKLQAKISNHLIQVISKTSLGAMGGISNMTDDITPKLTEMKKSLQRLDAQLVNSKKLAENNKNMIGDLDKSLASSKASLDAIKRTMNSAKKINDDIGSMATDATSGIQNSSASLKSALRDVSRILESSVNLAQSLNSIGDKGVQQAVISIGNIKDKIDQAAIRVINISQVLNDINVVNSNVLNNAVTRLNNEYRSLTDASSRLAGIIDQVNSTSSLTYSQVQDIVNIVADSNKGINDIISDFDDLVTRPLSRVNGNVSTITGDIRSMVDSTGQLYPSVNNFINTASTLNGRVGSSITILESSIDILRGQVSDSIKMIDEIQNNKDLKAFNNVIKSNILERADFIKNPVEIKEEKLYKMANYGSSMAPFYSVLAAWVGVIILSTILSTEPSKQYRSIDRYLGRLSFFLILSLIQSIIISTGDLLLLGVTAKEPVLFILILMLCSIAFCILIFTLVSCFKTLGKGIAMFLLVIQIGGSGGTFPVQMTPTFFRTINSVIPFTYGINACREAIGGVYMQNLLGDIGALLLFAIIPLIFGIMFKEDINDLLEPLSEKFEKSFLMH
ncbi:MAG: YhgE/Pip domain-containing protein [Peptostreptococcus stomatis]|uniref:YhgE/Pip domain-containing protein n=1 Tax=Peptostreptococcus stomatis TaxID=341694 RepID=UPI001A3C044E|nr:YhgE/Pip domain-containing protein [Peptostreptococcus stomatis]MBL6465872.1 YhgE/Pip domain-containing protein [Peptostreptococcus stomatis]